MKGNVSEEIFSFKSSSLFRKWLTKNHKNNDGFWLRIYKKDSGEKTISYQEALEEALCFGWIDGLKKSYDENSWIQKFTPRRLRSIWSKRNTDIIARLIKEKRIQPSGLEQVELAKKDGRWERAYDSPKDMKVPEDFIAELKKDKKAHAFFLTLNKANLYAIAWRLQTAKKEETRKRRMTAFIEMLKKSDRIHE
jgi:uncharacterized protein YdeI (YjbR/CyaY-like superfamily)